MFPSDILYNVSLNYLALHFFVWEANIYILHPKAKPLHVIEVQLQVHRRQIV